MNNTALDLINTISRDKRKHLYYTVIIVCFYKYSDYKNY